MSKDLAIDSTGDIQINPDTGDLVILDDNQDESYRVALGTNKGELSWNTDFGLNHLSLLSDLDDQSAVEDEISDYLESQFDNFVSAEVLRIERSGRVATINLKITSTDDDGSDQESTTEMEVDTNGIE